MEYPIINEMLNGQKPQTMFELGCSQGTLVADFARRNGVIVDGLDFEESYRERFKQVHPQGDFYTWDARRTPWPVKKHYDIAIAVGFFTLVSGNPIPMLKEMIRIADKVILAEWHVDAPSADMEVKETWTEIESTPFPFRVGRDFQKILNLMGREPVITKFKDKCIIKI